jgi:hypothetical protein
MRYRISLKEWEKIDKYNYANNLYKHMCTYSICQNGYDIIREQKINLFLYVLLFIPAHIIKVIILIWDGGIKNFRFAKRSIGYDIFRPWNDKYEIADKILKQRNK